MKWRCRATASTLRSCRSSTPAIVDHDRFGENYVLRRCDRSCVGILEQTAERRVRRPPAGAGGADDARLVDQLTDLINDVYATAERGLWREGWTRTTASELAELIGAREIAVAARHGQIVGSVRSTTSPTTRASSGCWWRHPSSVARGVGRALVAFAERESRERGLRAMQLELLVPRTWSHPSKEFLQGWYGRIGYRLIGSRGRRRLSAPRAAARHAVRPHRLREASRPRSETAMSKVNLDISFPSTDS